MQDLDGDGYGDNGNTTSTDSNQTTDETDHDGGSEENHTDDGHDHGPGEDPNLPEVEPEDPVEIPDVAPSLNF